MNACFWVEKEAILMILQYLQEVTLHLSHKNLRYIHFITADKIF